jgi:hypothetical protein
MMSESERLTGFVASANLDCLGTTLFILHRSPKSFACIYRKRLLARRSGACTAEEATMHEREQRALFFVRKGIGHALHFARAEVINLTISDRPLTAIRNGALSPNENSMLDI